MGLHPMTKSIKQCSQNTHDPVTEHGVIEQWSYTGSDPDLCTLSGLAAHYFSLLQQAWRLLWVDQGSSPRLRKTAQN
jgi:hypothetical protein